jgi:hypothetical protein
MDFAKLIERAKNICLSPQSEWQKIADESATTQSLFIYALILAIIPAVAIILTSFSMLRYGIGMAAVTYVITMIVIYIASLIVNALAPTFDGVKNPINALKVVVYSSTPGWLAGIFNVIPVIGWLVALVGGLYGIYVLYLGLSPCMKNPHDKSIGYTALIVVCYIGMTFVLMGVMVTMIFGSAMMGAAMMK